MTTQVELGNAGLSGPFNLESGLSQSQTITPVLATNTLTTFNWAGVLGQVIVTINCDENIFFAIGVNPDATVANKRRAMSANMRASFVITSGQQVAVAGR